MDSFERARVAGMLSSTTVSAVKRVALSSIKTTAVGSWPIPFGQRNTLKRFYAGELSEALAYDALIAAARIAMDEQIACGLNEISGGEVFAPDFVHHIAPRLSGVRAVKLRNPALGYAGVGQYEVIGPLGAPSGTGHAAAFRREKALEPRLNKAAVPSPYTITMTFADQTRLATHREQLVAIVANELSDLVTAGATEVQLDAPVEAIAAIQSSAASADSLAKTLAEWIAAAFAEVPTSVRRSVHFCLGDVSRQPATEQQNLRALLPLIQALEGKVDRALLECSYVGQWREHALLGDIPASIEVVAGIADVKSAPQSSDELRRKIDALVTTVGTERLLLSTSCGCGRMPHDNAIRLNRNLVKAAT